MTKEDVIRMAREAHGEINDQAIWMFSPLGLDRFASLIAAAEREACAKVCEKEAVQIVVDGLEERAYNNAVSDCASAIRAMSHQ